MTRKGSRVAFMFVVISGIALTCIILYTLVAGFSRFQALLLALGILAVLWAIIFSFFEVRRLARGSKSIGGEPGRIDPDAPRNVTVGPPTGEPYPHHELHAGNLGLDQGQLTSRLSGTPRIADLFRWLPHARRKS